MDKFSATWISHSSIGDYLKCPRGYYLKNIYKDPRSGHKICIVNPFLSLGLTVHEVLENLSLLPAKERFEVSLVKKFDAAWQNVTGKKGGFLNHQNEISFKERGEAMLKRVEENKGPLLNKAIKIKSDLVPNYLFSEKDNIILCGKIDWLEYLEETDSVHIIDFKTGRNEEDGDSLQLPIYLLLATNTQTKPVTKASYWYLDKDDAPVEKALPKEPEAYEKVYEIAKRIKLARAVKSFKCEHRGCMHCTPFERILKGDGEKVAVNSTRQDVYVLS